MTKPKFNPVISRIELNPEQAVLTCSCYSHRIIQNRASTRTPLANTCQSVTSKLHNNSSSRTLASASET